MGIVTGRCKAGGAETDAENIASQKVLLQSGFISNGKMGEEGPRFVVSLKR